MSQKHSTPVDPALVSQLDAAGAGPVEAVFTLRPPDGADPMDAGAVREKVAEIVRAAEESAGEKARDVHVMPLAQSFALAAPPGVVRAVLACKEIASALANSQPEGLAIDPRPGPKKGTRGGKPRKG